MVDELESILGIQAYPMNWPVGSGQILQGIYDLQKDELVPFKNASDHPEVVSEAMDEIELLRDAGNEFDADKIAHGKLTPVFLGQPW